MNPFRQLDRLFTWFSERLSRTTRFIILGILGVFLISSGVAAYLINDYFENDPDACRLCHVHDAAHVAWEKSEHGKVNCHDCHHSSKKEQVVQMYKFVFMGHKTVSPRHGEILVKKKFCMNCHWERNNKYPSAPLVTYSQYHSRHATTAGLECTQCHGYVIHKFPTEERFCVKCHIGKEVHGTGMEKLACLNCHTERTKNLRPGRKKCLFCHGGEEVRQELIAGGTIDVRHFQPSPAVIKKAVKIQVPDEAPMQFYCYECHQPHKKVRPDWNDCLKCHSGAPKTGKHEIHIQGAGLQCSDCHKPHVWKITEAQAKKDCVKCHDYKEPNRFLAP